MLLGSRRRVCRLPMSKIDLLNFPWLSVIDSHHDSSEIVRVFEHEMVHALQRIVSYLKETKKDKY